MSNTTPSTPREPGLVSLLKTLPEQRRECAYYVTIGVYAGVGLVVFLAGLYFAPTVTLSGGGLLGGGAWIKHLLGR